jgi:formiminoglutamase
MGLKDFFSPININIDILPSKEKKNTWLSAMEIYQQKFPDLDEKKIALIGIISEDHEDEANLIRSFLYEMKHEKYASFVADLGNYHFSVKKEKNIQELGYALSELIQKNIIPVIIGGGQILTLCQYLAFHYMKKVHNISIIDSRIDLDPEFPETRSKDNYLAEILKKDPSYMFNLSMIGYQGYYTAPEVIDFLDNFHFDFLRLGMLRENISELEPLLRSSELVSMDISAIRQSDAPASSHASPNGFSAEEACKIAHYAGLSDAIASLGIYNYESACDQNFQTAKLIAQMIWFFCEAVVLKEKEIHIGDTGAFTKYINTSISNYQIVFYKSKKSNRWWMEVPCTNKKNQYKEKYIIPCSYTDYVNAGKGEIPERWLKALKKLS